MLNAFMTSNASLLRRFLALFPFIALLALSPAHAGGEGGPYENLRAQGSDPQFRALFASWKQLDQVEKREAFAIPSLRPVKDIKDSVFTSGYGVRVDPFRGTAAMHSGIDLAGPIGTDIFATADGVIARAEWANGYGMLVEIDHGKGVKTRYGHLSRMMVKRGDRVKRGELIAKMGSTGRSTGSHLHYEVRLDGRAVNPIPFIQNGDYLLAMQRRSTTTQVALGGPDN